MLLYFWLNKCSLDADDRLQNIYLYTLLYMLNWELDYVALFVFHEKNKSWVCMKANKKLPEFFI